MTRVTTLLKSGAGRTVAVRAVSLAATFSVTLVAARSLSLTESGAFFLVLTLVTVFSTIGRWGTDNLAMRMSGAGVAALGSSWRGFVLVCVGASAATMAIVVSGAALLGPALGLDPALLRLGAWAVLPQALTVVAGSVLRGAGKLALGTFAELGSVPVLTVAGLSALWVWGDDQRASLAVLVLVAASWTTAAWAVLAASRAVGSDSTWSVARNTVMSHRGDLTVMMSTSLVFFVATWAPVFVLSAVRGPEEVALYATASRLANLVLLVPAVQVSYLAPQFSRLLHEGATTTLNALCGRSASVAIALAVVPCAVMAAFPSLLLGALYGDDFRPAAKALTLLAVASLAVVAAGQVNQLMLLTGDERPALVLNIATLMAWASFGSLATYAWGVSGAASYFLVNVVIYSTAATIILGRRRLQPFAWRRTHAQPA